MTVQIVEYSSDLVELSRSFTRLDTTCVIDGTYFHVNADGQTDLVFVPELEKPMPVKNDKVRSDYVKGLKDYDGGHLHAAERGGTREEINLVQMVSDFNRGNITHDRWTTGSWRGMEDELNRYIREGKKVSLEIRPDVEVVGKKNRPLQFDSVVRDKQGTVILQRNVYIAPGPRLP